MCAFANSAGGIIIYGVETDNNDKTKPKNICGTAIENIETFDRVLNSTLQPIPVYKTKTIQMNGKFVLVVYVPESMSAPHQFSKDHVFYHRSGSEIKAMEQDEVALYFGRKMSPKLSVTATCEGRDPSKHSQDDARAGESFSLGIHIQNTGRRLARFIQVLLYLPPSTDVEVIEGDKFTNISDLNHSINGQMYQYINNIGVIHPGPKQRIGKLNLSFKKTLWSAENTIVKWEIYADEMQAQSGEISLSTCISSTTPHSS